MGELTALAWILIAIALIAGVGAGSALRRPKTIVEDADAKKLEHLELTNARLEDELESKAADNKAWADSHQAVANELEAAKEQLETATNPPELGEARAKVDELSVELERAKEQAGKVETLTAELDTARGRAAALERELTTARSVPQIPVADFTKTAALEERIAVLSGELEAARTKITELEAQIAD